MKTLKRLLLTIFVIMIGLGIAFGMQRTRTAMNKVLFSDTRTVQEQTPEGYTFYYPQLSEQEQKAYRAVLYGVSHGQNEFYIGKGYTAEILERTMYAFIYDYPEYYWCLRYQTKIYEDQSYDLVFDRMANRLEESGRVREEAESIVNKVIPRKSKYKQLKAIYDYIIKHTDYVENAQYDQDIRSVLLNGKSVCSGYAKTFQYLCKLAGIECTTVNGYSTDQNGAQIPHAWNLVHVKGKFYWVDVTWGDSKNLTQGKYINYNYFLVGDDPFLNLHQVDEYMDHQTREYRLFIYPECQDDSLNYYSKKGCYFRSYDKKKVKQYIVSRLKKNLHTRIELQYAGRKAYKKAYRDLIRDKNIEEIYRDFIPYNTSVSYEYSFDKDSYYMVFSVL